MDRFNKGMVLPLVIVLSLIILTSIGFWYRKILVQSFLSERLVVQRSSYNECKSLMPVLRKSLDAIPKADLSKPGKNFMVVKTEGKMQWRIDRSIWIDDRVVFTFARSDVSQESIRLTMGYTRKEN